MNYLYFINISELSWSAVQSQRTILPIKIKNQIEQFRFEQDKCRSLIGKMLVSYILKKHENYQANTLPIFNYNDYQKPYIEGMKGGFNISHAGDWVICGYNTQGDIGVDIEKIVPVNLDDYREVLTDNEYQYTKHNKEFDFYQLWTLKEAIIKADGRGFFLPPNSFEIPYPFKNDGKISLGSGCWFLYSMLIDKHYYLAIASASEINNNIELKRLFFDKNDLSSY